MHVHACEVCKVQVSICSDDSCSDPTHANHGKHFCSTHHPDPLHRIEQAPPPPRYAVLVKDQKAQ